MVVYGHGVSQPIEISPPLVRSLIQPGAFWPGLTWPGLTAAWLLPDCCLAARMRAGSHPVVQPARQQGSKASMASRASRASKASKEVMHPAGKPRCAKLAAWGGRIIGFNIARWGALGSGK